MAKQKDTGTELRKLNRGELLTMLISITKRCEELEEQLDEVNKKLEDREIKVAEVGTLAEAMIKINGVMEAADKASREYVENIRRMYENQDDTVLAMLDNTKEQCALIERETKARCQDMIERAREESQSYWDDVNEKIIKYKQVVDSMKEILKNQQNQA